MAIRCSDLCIHVRISHFTSTDSPRRSQGCLGARARRVAMTTTDAPPRPTRGAQSNPFLTPSTPPRQPFSPLQSRRTHPLRHDYSSAQPSFCSESVAETDARASDLFGKPREGIFPLTITGIALTRRETILAKSSPDTSFRERTSSPPRLFCAPFASSIFRTLLITTLRRPLANGMPYPRLHLLFSE